VNEINFNRAFEQLTGNEPFPWQRDLYESWFSQGNIPPSCNLPTGLGKTSVIGVWLIALANGTNVPRRLVYVVNRRTVVDQTTDEVKRYRERLQVAGLYEPLRQMCAIEPNDSDSPLAISTLRGQFADNREWSADPSRPAVICGTVDMIGSRLLFSGYGVGMKAKPLHAGFLGQDALLIHDEAHLEPAFQTLIETIGDEQRRSKDFRPLRVMALTATSRGEGEVFGLNDEDKKHPVVVKRITAKKALHLHPLDDPKKKLAEQLAAKALEFADKNRAVLVFARTVEDVLAIASKLPKDGVVTLTGTMRGKERDELVGHSIFKRFLPGGQSEEPTTYLVCTSAGEVGVNISADHLVCDLTPFDSMAQRFGRVNRFGDRDDTEIHVFHPQDGDFEDTPYEQARKKTLALLRDLKGDACPDALGRLDSGARQAGFTPTPTILPVTDILFDAWALTTVLPQSNLEECSVRVSIDCTEVPS
jgi:CRISPR-associated endonuclease/helicase Cas3